MVGIYFSGTGNTEHCIKTFLRFYKGSNKALSIEDRDAVAAVWQNKEIVLGYPVYFSNVPKILRDFIDKNKKAFRGKRVFILATMALWSGDGAGCSARLLQTCGAEIVGGLHLKMPDCIGDEGVLKRSLEENRQIIRAAEAKIAVAVQLLKNGNPPQDGLSRTAHLGGLLGQRLWFYGKTITYKTKPKIDPGKCVGCGKCVVLCPMKNLGIKENIAVGRGRCTLCYRCFAHCPTQAITILGRTVIEQCFCEKYKEPKK